MSRIYGNTPMTPTWALADGARPASALSVLADYWDFEDVKLAAEAEQWERDMMNENLVLRPLAGFERAQCGLTREAGHFHTDLCAGPTAEQRRIRRAIIKERAEAWRRARENRS